MIAKRVLIVEDEAVVALDLEEKLERLDYVVPGTASSGEAAIEKAAELKPDLVLMDIGLTGNLDGVEASKQIRDRLDIPVVYLTAHADEATLARAVVSEPFGYLLKPVDDKLLPATIEIALYKHRADRRLRESEQWLTSILRSTGDGVVTANDRGLVSFVNPVAEGLTGCGGSDAIGVSVGDLVKLVGGDLRDLSWNPLEQALREGVSVALPPNSLLLSAGGQLTPVDGRVAPITDDLGNFLGMVLTLHDVTQRKLAEEAVRRARDELEVKVEERTAELKTTAEELKLSRRRVVKAQEDVRKTVAEQLHGSVQARLLVATHWLTEARQRVSPEHDATEKLQMASDLIGSLCQNELRAAVRRLHPSLIRRSLEVSLLSLADQFQGTLKVDVSVNQRGSAIGELWRDGLSEELRLTMYRVAEEALNNALKHAQASQVYLELDQPDPDRITMIIRDDGIGFDMATATAGFGVLSMRDYCGAVGGALEISSGVGEGTTVCGSFPLAATPPEGSERGAPVAHRQAGSDSASDDQKNSPGAIDRPTAGAGEPERSSHGSNRPGNDCRPVVESEAVA